MSNVTKWSVFQNPVTYIGLYQAIFYVTQKINTVPRVNERLLINNKKYLNKECGGLMTKDNLGDHYAMMPLHYLFLSSLRNSGANKLLYLCLLRISNKNSCLHM